MDYLASLTFGTIISGPLMQNIPDKQYDFVFGERYLNPFNSVSFRDLIPNFVVYNAFMCLADLFMIVRKDILSVGYHSKPNDVSLIGDFQLLSWDIVIHQIIPYLPSKTLTNFTRTCKTFYSLRSNTPYWTKLMRGDSTIDTALISFNFYCDNQRRLLKIDSFDYYKEDIEYAIQKKIQLCREGYGSLFLLPYIYKDRVIITNGKYHTAMEIIRDNPETVVKLFNLYVKVDSPVKEFVDFLFSSLLDEIRELLPYELRKEINAFSFKVRQQ
jgi:hypothetical protein